MSLEKTMKNRQIKADRVYKTLGRMSWQRVVLGIVLLIFVLMLAGIGAEFCLNRGQYDTAQKLIVAEKWMAEYKGAEKKLIDAGAALESGEPEKAYELIAGVGIAELPIKFLDEYADVCGRIGEFYGTQTGEEAAARAEEMKTAEQNALLTLQAGAK